MSFYDLLILQIIAHLLADFVFQNDLWIRHRNRFEYRSKILYWHVLIVFVLSWLLSFQLWFALASLAISIIHFLVDGAKAKVSRLKIRKTKPFERRIFFIDQFIHLAVIFPAVYAYTAFWNISPYLNWNIESKYLLIILGYLFCLKPANILIKEIFNFYRLKNISHMGYNLLNAGKLIGNIERILTLSLILSGQFSSVGFIIAAKSIIRFKDTEVHKTEYMLIGSLLSFGIAILIGMGIKRFGF